MSLTASKSKKILVRELESLVVPEITRRGLSPQKKLLGGPQNWNFHRMRIDGNYDVISITMAEKQASFYYAILGTIPRDGIRQISGKHMAAEEATAFHLSKRVYLQKKRKGILALALPFWFSHQGFGFKLPKNQDDAKKAAEQTCLEFMSCLDQADDWWATGKMGPNLIIGEIFSGQNDRNNNQQPSGNC